MWIRKERVVRTQRFLALASSVTNRRFDGDIEKTDVKLLGRGVFAKS